MNYVRIIAYCQDQLWALEKSKLETLSRFIMFAAAGGKMADEDVARITKKLEQQVARNDAADIGVLPIFGVLAQRMNMMEDISGGTSMQQVATDFRAMLGNPAIKAIILDIDSPGGTVFGTEELAREIHDSRGIKPIVAQVDSLAASAAYWIAAQADEIVVTPSGQAGSIGVYTIHEDISEFLAKEGVKETIIKSDPHKLEAPDSAPLSDEARGMLQARVDQSRAAFVKAVSRGRKVPVSTVNDRFGKGRMFGAADLVERGMADRIATLPETLERFGASVHPIASAARARNMAHAQARETLITKLKAGEPPTRRELEHGFRGLIDNMSKSESVLAVQTLSKALAQGEPEKPTEATVVAAADIADMSRQLADIRKLLRA